MLAWFDNIIWLLPDVAQLTYQTWPLSMHPNDMSLLAPLSQLRAFHCTASDEEAHHLLALTTHVIEVLSGAWTQLSSLHYTGRHASSCCDRA